MLSIMGQVLSGLSGLTGREVLRVPFSGRSSRRSAGLACLCVALTVGSFAQVSVPTYHNNKQRTGSNILETTLTPSNVNPAQFGKLFSQAVDGFVYAQPLYVSNVNVAGLGIHNVVYVATMNDSVYAFDADSKTGSNAKPLWHVSFVDPENGSTPVGPTDVTCTDLISTRIGILSTPVIDTVGGTLYVLARTKESGQFYQRLHALDITSGAEKFGGPVAIQASVSGTGAGAVAGKISFNPKIENQRSALLLQNGMVYIAWGSHCDSGPYHGWVMGYDSQALVQRVVWLTTPSGVDGAIWESGSGPAADATSTYIAVANGTFDANTGGNNYGQSIVKLGPPAAGKIAVTDYFTPYNGPDLNTGDWDIGSGGAMLLPDQPNGPHLHLLVQGDKKGDIFLVDRDNMGHYNSQDNSQIVQSLPGAVRGMWNSPTWWSNHVYLGGGGDTLKVFALNPIKGLLSDVPTSHTTNTFGYPGTTVSVSANISSNAIVWALDNSMFKSPNGQAVLYAYDATNLATELYDSSLNPVRDNPGPAVKFTVPTVANGKVYVGTRTRLSVYGLLPTASAREETPKRPAAAEAVSGPVETSLSNSPTVRAGSR